MENHHFKKISGMKRNNFIGIFKLGLLAWLVVIVGSSCVKSVSGRTDFESLAPTVLIPEGGLQNFGVSALLFPGFDDADTAYFHLEYAATSVAPQDEVITVKFDPDAITAYNATLSNPLDHFIAFPDSIFSFTPGSFTVQKGNNYTDNIPFIVFPSKINPKVNYMYPITITTAPAGSTIATNHMTLYYHLIGNPIAGAYTDKWLRWNAPAVPPAPPSLTATIGVLFAPINGTSVSIPDNTGINYILSFDNDGAGNLSNFSVSLDAASVTAAGITAGSPTLISADPTTGTYHFTFPYVNSAGSARIIDDTYTQ
jgi:Domain of unknown function (DUF1735)